MRVAGGDPEPMFRRPVNAATPALPASVFLCDLKITIDKLPD
jgi:hypothetical protein